jgi:peptidoglycan/xylan/chitin deacetylase (PgdA/CDA1 family)
MSPVWRAPYGEYNRQICRWAGEAGWLHVGWGQGRGWRRNLDSNDWIGSEDEAGFHTPQEVLDKIIALAAEEPQGINGGIILMHLGTVRSSGQQVHRILGRLIDELSAKGYRFITVSEMVRESGLRLESLARKSETPAADQSAQ